MKPSKYRVISREVIDEVIANNPGAKGKELQRLLRHAYPFGPKSNHPYDMWLDEVRIALGKKSLHKTKAAKRNEDTQTLQLEL